MREALTARQKSILMFIMLHQKKTGSSPTRQDICDAFGFSSPNAANDHIKSLERKGAIKILPYTSRGIVVLKTGIERKCLHCGEPIPEI